MDYQIICGLSKQDDKKLIYVVSEIISGRIVSGL